MREIKVVMKTVLICTLIGILLGALLGTIDRNRGRTKAGGNCISVALNDMAPILGGFGFGIVGFFASIVLSPIVVIMDKVVQHQEVKRQITGEKNELSAILLRPFDGNSQETLLRFAPESSRRAASSLSDRFTQQNRFLLLGAFYGICWDKMGVT